VEFIGGANASDRERFKNLRAESHWGIRTRLEEGRLDLSRLQDADYRRLAQQATSIKWKENERGQIVIEQKASYMDRMRREHGPERAKSPDELDALTILYSNIRSGNTGKVAGGSSRKLTRF
jgi:hypothetical protein